MTLKVEQLTKTFDTFTAVNQLSLTAESGKIFGLIGQNGAGKTTTFRMILNLLTPTSGQVSWDGRMINQLNRDKIGYLPEERGLYPKMKVDEQLVFFGRLRGKTKSEMKKEADYWLERFGLSEKKKVLTETLSKGNQQKVQLIISLIHQPSLLILDEPFSGLDPVNAELLKRAIIDAKDRGAAIIFSSHRMDHVEELCDHLCLMKAGRSLFSGPIDALRKQFGKINLTVRGPFSKEKLAALPGVKAVTQVKDDFRLLLESEEKAHELFPLITHDRFIECFSLNYLSLEEIFKRKVGEPHVSI